MYRLVFLIIVYSSVQCANIRYGDTTTSYQYSTISNPYSQYPYKSGTYGSDIANFPDSTKYPSYRSGNSYNTMNGYSGNGNVYQQPGYTTPTRYGDSYGRTYSAYEFPFVDDSTNGYCKNRSPQIGIWVDSLMGMWYGVEFIQHLAGDSVVDYTRTCIVIHISEPMDRPSTENQLFHVQTFGAKFRQQNRNLRLLWDEAGQTIDFALYFQNDSAGYWQVYGMQNGSIPQRSSYQQFSGSVQVLKAVNDHMVLNFCQEQTDTKPAQLYSVLFSREPSSLARWEIESVHSMLQNKKLSVASRRMVCGNNAPRIGIHGLVISLLSCLLACVIRSS